MRGGWIAVLLLAGCVPAGAERPGEVMLVEGGDEPPPPQRAADDEGSAPAGPAAPDGTPPDARALFDRVEMRLLEAAPLSLAFDATAEGAVEAEVSGRARFEGEGRLVFEARGTFAGEVLDGRLEADGETLRGGSGAGTVEQPVPPALKEAMVLGFVRMGILHNVARLAGGRPPDHADGEVHPWVVTEGHRLGERTTVDGVRAWPLSFELTVDGEPSGEATLWLDVERELPVRREQVVRFPEGEMRVVERYSSVVAGTD